MGIDMAKLKKGAPKTRIRPSPAPSRRARSWRRQPVRSLLGNPARLHVLWLAARGGQDVTALADRAGVGVATMSQHLTKLRLAGLISVRREGRRHIYTVDDPHVVTMVEQIFAHIAPNGSLAPDPPA